ncbi:hypothetical protein PHYSODRAFT_259056 [Phytophthora sojae]|uniref:Uncharacterized protein n=1 Tax=Phytophthora sojae (strain P6497) TaxID=1094619 RepID=G4ZE24_PHYSP|nr:hypothetical protein PHYSODRAFT_259056 [Phytophthora sojae]EGZ16945.1 hypothetical protein PHYSODRAFT_259056 [Phytophthora sojae]|eukprot:XP_009526003.1 hypothetical protein PHYSODRAFT_259056 [Phytophthora sojae]
MPLVLHYHNQHYSVYVHSTPAQDIAAEEGASEEDVEMAGSDDGDLETRRPSATETTDPATEAQAAEKGDLPQETEAGRGWYEEMKTEEDAEPNAESQYGSQSPWDPEAWSGNLEEVEERLSGPTIYHTLKQEIDQILRVGGERTQELLHFLVAMVSQLSLHQQKRLLAADLSDPEQCKKYMVEFQIPEPVVRQWRQRLEEEKSGDTQPVTELRRFIYFPSGCTPANTQA